MFLIHTQFEFWTRNTGLSCEEIQLPSSDELASRAARPPRRATAAPLAAGIRTQSTMPRTFLGKTALPSLQLCKPGRE